MPFRGTLVGLESCLDPRWHSIKPNLFARRHLNRPYAAVRVFIRAGLADPDVQAQEYIVDRDLCTRQALISCDFESLLLWDALA